MSVNIIFKNQRRHPPTFGEVDNLEFFLYSGSLYRKMTEIKSTTGVNAIGFGQDSFMKAFNEDVQVTPVDVDIVVK